MQPIIPQQYLLRLNKNLICYFFLCDDKSLHYNTYNGDNVLLSSNKLLSDIINFSVAVDKHEEVHLICITSEGELQHYMGENNNWNHRIVSKLDMKSNIYKYLTLHVNDEYIHLFYVKTNLLVQTLSTIEHMYWNGNNVNRIVVSNYIHGKYSSPLQVSFDDLKNFHIVYKAFYKDNHQLYYKKFNISTKIWTIDELITDPHEEHSHPYTLIDKEQNLHLLWCTIEQNNFILKYKRKCNIIDTKPRWSDTQTLSNKVSNYLSPILIQESNTLKIYCKQNDKIIEIISNDFGDSWADLTNGKLYVIEESKIVQYSDNPQTNSKYLAKHVYGNIKDTIQIVGMDLFNNKEEDKPSPIQPASDQEQDYLIDTVSDQEQTSLINTSPDQEQDSLIDTDEKIDMKILLTEDITDLVKDMDNKIDTILSQIVEHKSENCPANISIQEINHTTCEAKQNNNEIIDFDKPDSTIYNTEGSGDIINELLSEYGILEKQFFEIKERKQELTKSISDYEIDLNLLEEKIVNYKKQMLVFQEKLSNVTSNNGIFQRFINFFK